jgi:hypothetical protein
MSQLAASDGQPGNWEEPGSFCVGFRPQGLKSKAGRSRVNREVHARKPIDKAILRGCERVTGP